MITIDPNRINVLRKIAGTRQATAESLMEAVGAEAAEIDNLRKEIQKAYRRHERSGAGAEELALLRNRHKAAQDRYSEALQRAEIARDDTRAARKLFSRCNDFLAREGGSHGI